MHWKLLIKFLSAVLMHCQFNPSMREIAVSLMHVRECRPLTIQKLKVHLVFQDYGRLNTPNNLTQVFKLDLD